MILYISTSYQQSHPFLMEQCCTRPFPSNSAGSRFSRDVYVSSRRLLAFSPSRLRAWSKHSKLGADRGHEPPDTGARAVIDLFFSGLAP